MRAAAAAALGAAPRRGPALGAVPVPVPGAARAGGAAPPSPRCRKVVGAGPGRAEGPPPRGTAAGGHGGQRGRG